MHTLLKRVTAKQVGWELPQVGWCSTYRWRDSYHYRMMIYVAYKSRESGLNVFRYA